MPGDTMDDYPVDFFVVMHGNIMKAHRLFQLLGQASEMTLALAYLPLGYTTRGDCDTEPCSHYAGTTSFTSISTAAAC